MSQCYRKRLFAKGEPLFLSGVSEKACTAILQTARAGEDFWAALTKERIVRGVNGLEEESRAEPLGR
jgi:hypothetical protein